MKKTTFFLTCMSELYRLVRYSVYFVIILLLLGCITLGLLASYLYHNPHKINKFIDIAGVDITVAAFDAEQRSDSIVIIVRNLEVIGKAIRVDIEHVDIALGVQQQFPYLQVDLAIQHPVIKSYTAMPTTLTQNAPQPTKPIDLQSTIDRLRLLAYVNSIALHNGRIVYTTIAQTQFSVAMQGDFAHSESAPTSWHANITITHDATPEISNNKQQYTLSVSSSYNTQQAERITSVQIADDLLLRHVALAQSVFALDKQHTAVGDVRARTEIVIASNNTMTEWRGTGHTQVSSKLALPIKQIVWRTHGDVKNGTWFLRVRDTAATQLDVSIHHTQATIALDAQMRRFEFTAFMPVLRVLAIDTKIVGISGAAKDVVLRARFVREHSGWKLAHNNARLYVDGFGYQLQQGHGAPAFSGISGEVVLDGMRAVLQLDSPNFTMTLPRIFRTPMSFTKTKGVFEFVTTPQFDNLRTTTRNAMLYPQGHRTAPKTAQQAHATIDMVWEVGARHTLDLDIDVYNMDANYVKQRYFPNALLTHVGTFLDTSIRAGVVETGTVLLDLDATDEIAIDVDVALDFNQVTMRIPSFAPLRAENVHVATNNKVTRISVPTAKMHSVTMTDVAVAITHVEQSVVSVDGSIAGTLANLRDLRFATGVLRVPHVIATRDLLRPFAGNWRADVQATWSLASAQPPFVRAAITVDKWQAQSWFGQKVNRFDGLLVYQTDLGVERVQVNNMMMNDVVIAVDKANNHTRLARVPINLSGFVPAAYTTGQAYTDVALRWNANTQTLRATWLPDWDSFAVHTPLFSKPQTDNWQSRIDTEFVISKQETIRLHGFVERLHFNIAKRTDYTGCVYYDDSGDTDDTSNADNTLGNLQQSGAIQPSQPHACANIASHSPQDHLLFLARAHALRAAPIAQFITDMSQVPALHTSTPSARQTPATSLLLSPLPTLLDVVSIESQRVSLDGYLDGYDASPVSLQLVRQSGHTQTIAIDSNWAQGQIIANSRLRTVGASFTHLAIAIPDNTQQEVSQTGTPQANQDDPWQLLDVRTLPQITLHAVQFSLDNRKLGTLHGTVTPSTQGGTMRSVLWQAHTKAHGIQLTVSGKWSQQTEDQQGLQHQSSCSIQIAMNDYQLNKNTQVQTANVTSQVAWQGSPAALSYPRINGTINLDVTNAYVHDTDSQAVALLRLTGLLNILNIVELLALEGSDQHGALLLKKTTANMRLINGTLSHTKPLAIDAIGFTASSEGTASLVTGEVDMTANIELKLEQTLSLAALVSNYPAILASPAIGIPLAWITHKMVIEPLTHFSYRITGNAHSKEGVQVQNISIEPPQTH